LVVNSCVGVGVERRNRQLSLRLAAKPAWWAMPTLRIF
jgi:hypothetical protein